MANLIKSIEIYFKSVQILIVYFILISIRNSQDAINIAISEFSQLDLSQQPFLKNIIILIIRRIVLNQTNQKKFTK